MCFDVSMGLQNDIEVADNNNDAGEDSHIDNILVENYGV